MSRKSTINNIISLAFIAVIFIAISYAVQKNLVLLESLMQDFHFLWGILIYIALAFITTVIAPLTSVPLMPIASNLWGWQVTAVASIFAWSLGSLVAFFIAVRFGKPIVKKFVSLEKIEKYEHKIPQEHIFWTIVLLRVVIPVDVLSYALGIFTKVSYKVYMSATVLGITPFAFVLSYIGVINFKYQLVIFFAAFIVAVFALVVRLRFLKRKNDKNSLDIT